MKELLIGVVFGLLIMYGSISYYFLPVDSAIPPTPAFQNILINDTDSSTRPVGLNATKYNDDLWIISDGSIQIEIVQYNGGVE